LDGEQDLTECANKAYGKSLKKYHGWVVRGVFSLAAKAAPTRKQFVESLLGTTPETGKEEECIHQLDSELTAYLAGIDRCLKSLNKLYSLHNLDPDP